MKLLSLQQQANGASSTQAELRAALDECKRAHASEMAAAKELEAALREVDFADVLHFRVG